MSNQAIMNTMAKAIGAVTVVLLVANAVNIFVKVVL